MQRRVAITGLGLVTPIGTGRRQVWENLLAGTTAFDSVRSFDASGFAVDRAAEIEGFSPSDYVERLDPRTLGRSSQLAIAAARMAIADAGLDHRDLDPLRSGVAMGTTSGEPVEVERFDDRLIADEPERIDADFVSRYACNVIPEMIASELGLCGPNIMIPAACAAGNYAIAYGFSALRSGRADLMLAGGADSFSRITYAGFARLGAIAPELCQPFDRNRKGMIPGEAGGVLVLEPLDAARQRGARIYAEISGFGLSCDAHHMTGSHPAGRGAVRAMEKALEQSRLAADSVDYVSAHGTGTTSNDRLETVALKRVFRQRAARLPVSSIKSMIGHTMGAASVVEAAACALAIHTGVVPPTANLVEPDPECDLDYVPNTAREVRVDVAMNNAYAFGGNNASLILQRATGA